MGHVTGQHSNLSQKENKSNLNSTSNYKSPFCPFGLIQNSNFKMEAEFENVPRSKVVEFENLSNFHFWRFSTSLENLGVI